MFSSLRMIRNGGRLTHWESKAEETPYPLADFGQGTYGSAIISACLSDPINRSENPSASIYGLGCVPSILLGGIVWLLGGVEYVNGIKGANGVMAVLI